MKSTFKSFLAVALAASTLGGQSANAFTIAKHISPAAQSSVSGIAWRGHGYGGGYGRGYGGHHRGFGGAAIVGGIVAGALIAGAIRESRASGSDLDRCESSYRSFDRSSGTYTGYDGERHVCPYLE